MRTVIAGLLVMAAGSVYAATDLYIYPKSGQDEGLQRRDRYECHVWASGQTGFDPSTYQAPQRVILPPPGPRRHGERFGSDPITGAAQGAAVGAVGGAIGGDAGKGAAIGAGVGALLGAFHTLERDSDRKQAEQQREAAGQQVEIESKREDYNRAISACLEARGYTVK